jgi:hypothetical protein
MSIFSIETCKLTLSAWMLETAKEPLRTRSCIEVFAQLCPRIWEREVRTEAIIADNMREIAFFCSEWTLHGLVECAGFGCR